MIEYGTDYLTINGKPFLFVPVDVIQEGMCGYYFGKISDIKVDPDSFSTTLNLIFEDYSPYFNVSEVSKQPIRLETFEEIRAHGIDDEYLYRVISIEFNMNCPEYEKIIKYYKNYKLKMPMRKFEKYSKKILGISEDF